MAAGRASRESHPRSLRRIFMATIKTDWDTLVNCC